MKKKKKEEEEETGTKRVQHAFEQSLQHDSVEKGIKFAPLQEIPFKRRAVEARTEFDPSVDEIKSTPTKEMC